MKLKGEFHIIDVKYYGLRLIFTPDDYSIIDKIHELAGFQNKSEYNSISLSMDQRTPFFNHKNIFMDQNKCRLKPNALKKIKMRGCVAVCFSSFSIIYDRLNSYAKQVKVNEFLEENRLIFQMKLFSSSYKSYFPSSFPSSYKKLLFNLFQVLKS